MRAANAYGAGSYKNLAVTINCREVVSEVGDGFDLLVYPNPSKNFFTVHVESLKENNYSLIVRDVIGRVVYQRQDISFSESFDFGAELSSGMYFAEIKQGDERKMVRLIKNS